MTDKSRQCLTVGLHWLAVLLITLDRWFKAWVLLGLRVPGQTLPFSFSLNRRLAFSLPLWPWLIDLLVWGMASALIWYYLKLRQQKNAATGLIFMTVLGAFSNLIDRFFYGGVIDYLNFGSLSFFNLADAMISFGLSAWLFLKIRQHRQPAAVGPRR